MEVRLASEAAPGRPINEDYGFALPRFVGVLDGVSAPDGIESGCIHGPAWYVRHLTTQLCRGYVQSRDSCLSDLLATAIEATRGDHEGRCDLAHPSTPASTVSLLRADGDRLDFLVLCDSPVVVDRGGVIEVLTDERHSVSVAKIRAEALDGRYAIGTEDHTERVRQVVTKQRELTNQPHGYWIAAANPAAAHEAVTGTLSLQGDDRVRRAALLTDGASRAVDDFALFDWQGLLDVLTTEGPQQLIRRVRDAELSDEDRYARPRYKRHDDATAAICLFTGEA